MACLLLAAIVLQLAGCPATDDTRNNGQEEIEQSAVAAENEIGTATAQTGQDSRDAEPTADSQPQPPSFIAWELDGFRLGMGVAEARSLLRGEIENYIQEQWRYEGQTGVIIAGTYNDPIGMQGSLLFHEGELVAVIANRLQEEIAFKQRLAELGKAYGESRRDPPEFARGYRFIEAMAADERQPDIQYLWADEPSQTLLLAGYYSQDVLATYMLIDASRYDLVAQAMEELSSADSGSDEPGG